MLTGHAARDANQCRDLAKAGVDAADVATECSAMCAATGAVAARVATVQVRGVEDEGFLLQLDGQYRVMCRNEAATISA